MVWDFSQKSVEKGVWDLNIQNPERIRRSKVLKYFNNA